MSPEMMREDAIRHLAHLKDPGHVGEGTHRRKLRERHNDALDLAIAALTAPARGDADHIGDATQMIAAAPAAPAGDWRPIESAPRDGTSVDLWIEPVEESPDSFYLHNEAHRCANTYYSNYHWHGAEWPWKPTHWQPLPLPPAPVEEG